jgi:hypothetical protein
VRPPPVSPVLDGPFKRRQPLGWNRFIEKHYPDAMLLRNDLALRQAALAGGQWKLVYEDERYSVLLPATVASLPAISPRHVDYLDEHGRMIKPYLP